MAITFLTNEDEKVFVKSVNGGLPDENGNVEIALDNAGQTVDMNKYAKVAYVDEQLEEVKADMIQQTPLFAESIEGCTDTSKVYVLPDGYIYAYSSVETEKSPNLNDGVYEYGRFTSAGTEYDSDIPIEASFRNVNYLPVEGGRTIKGYYDESVLGHYGIDIVQYDADKNILVARQFISTLIHTDGTTELELNPSTAFIRIDVNANGIRTYDLSAVQVAIYYKEDAVAEFIEYTGEDTVVGWKSTGHAFVPADYEDRIVALEDKVSEMGTAVSDILYGKKIIYDGDSIAESRTGTSGNNGGGYAKIIAEVVSGTYVNQAVGGGILRSASALGKTNHSVVDNLVNLPMDGDLYCFEGGINDWWGNATLGTYTLSDFTGELDTTTICGALETIFRFALNNFTGKPICFVITHKIQNSAYAENGAGNTFKEYHDTMAGICEKYSIPYYDAFSESGLNGWNAAQVDAYLNGADDACHPNAEGYKRYYVPQLLALFRRIMPVS